MAHGTPTRQFSDVPRARIYVLMDPRNLEIRYVGMTTQALDVRLKAHIRDRKRDDYRTRWIISLRQAGLTPLIAELEEVPVEERAGAERKWIAFYRQEGARLVNATDGGEGTLGRTKTAEERRKIGEASRRKFEDPAQRALVSVTHRGKVISEEHRQRVSTGGRRRWDEWRTSGQVVAAETRARIVAGIREKNRQPHSQTEETRAKIAEAKRRWWTERRATGEIDQIRKNMSQAMKRSAERKGSSTCATPAP